MEIRQLTIEDWAPYSRLMSEAFGGEIQPTEITNDHRRAFKLSKRLGAFVDGDLIAALTIIDFDSYWNGKSQRMGGIAGVGCAVSARGRGYVGALIDESLRIMRGDGQVVSGLFPFSHAFYRKYGWESVVAKRRITIPTRLFPSHPEGKNVRTYSGTDGAVAARTVYDQFASRYQGMIRRTDDTPSFVRWDRRLRPEGNRVTYVQVYIDPATNRPDGYFTFRFPSAGETAALGEFVALTESARRGLISTLHYYGTQIDAISWNVPVDDPITLLIAENEVHTALTPMYMGRVVDAAAALAALQPVADGHVSLGVRDEHAKWNNATFDISAEGNAVTVEPSTRKPQIETDIQTLSHACWGTYPLTALRDAGRIAVADEPAFAFLSGLLPQRIPHISDHF